MTSPGDKSRLQQAQQRLSSVVSTLIPNSLTGSTSVLSYNFPKFDDLPPVPGQPVGCLWGFFDKHGSKDELGTLNLLTPAVVHAASSEIRTGRRVQLDRQFENGQGPAFGRKPFEQKTIDYSKSSKLFCFDDEICLNTQASSQWDGLKHFAHQSSQMYYNSLLHGEACTSQRNGIHNWGDAGGIVGRGILVDWVRWYEHRHGTPPVPDSRHEIPISELQEALAFQSTTTRPGDILIVRSGYGRWLE